MFELENLFELVKDGAFSSKEEFLSVAKNLSSNELFSILKEGSFGSVEELESILKKKKDTTVLPSEDGLLESQKDIEKKPEITLASKDSLVQAMKNMPVEKYTIQQGVISGADLIEEDDTFLEGFGKNIMAGLNDFNKMITSVPESIYNIFAIPQNAIAYATGLDIATDADKFKEVTGITNPIYDAYKKEGERLEKEINEFNEKRYESSSIYENIQQGNYLDAFELLGSGIARSAPTSLAIMAGGATLKTGELTAAITTAFYNQNLEELKAENPDASAIENNIKALGMSAAEGVFSSIGIGQIGAVYKDIIKKEGVEAGSKIFKDGLVEAYKGALKKYGVPIGALGEGLEEAATQITQNMIKGRPAFEGAADAFILGGGSGVVFTAPISLKNAKDKIKNNVEKSKDNKEIIRILDGNKNDFVKIYDVSKNDEINEKQLAIASLSKSRDILLEDLSKSVKKGEITKEQASQSLYIFDKTQQLTGQLRDTNLDEKSKLKVANLLKEREALNEKIRGKEDVLSVLEKERIEQINNEIKDVFLKSKPEYIIDQKQYTKEEFIAELEGKNQEELNAMNIVVNNDQETANIVTEKFKTDAVAKETPQVTKKRAERISEIESIISNDDATFAETGNRPLLTEARTELQNELQTLKTEQDAIQEQTTGQVPVQSETTVSQTVEEGTPQAESEVVTEQVTQEKLEKPYKTFNDGSGKMVTVTTETTEKEGVKKTKFKTETTNRKGEPRTQNDKGYNSFEEAVENLDIDLQSEQNESALELVDALKESQGKETLPARVQEIIESTDVSSPFFGFKTATVIVGNQKIEFRLKNDTEITTEEVSSKTQPEIVTEQVTQEEVAQPESIIVAEVFKDTNVEIKNNKIEGKLFNEQEAKDYQDLIESNYSDVVQFGQKNQDIRTNVFNYDAPIAEKNVNGVNLRITEGLIETDPKTGNKRKTYLLYADGKISGKFYSVSDIKKVVKFIENNLVKNIKETQPQTIIKEQVSSKTQPITQIETQNETGQQPTVQPERTGDRTGRDTSRTITPLEGSPTIQGATGPDANLVAVAEQYAADNGIDLKRQSEYVVVDEERAKRIADAYEQMVNDPQNPKVKEAYEDLIRQTKAQYDALVAAGYEFTFFDDQTDPYSGNPYNAMRDLRNNKKMAVFGTFAGYGTEGITDSEIENNPLLEDTGLRWKDQNGNEQIVTANDLFRAVHDAFGHGLEGTGFRARGEENAWQAHVRLFTGPAIAALTSETRGQNSWLNYGPFGETNRTAKVDDTVFAEQKIGLMPEFTWTEGRAGDMQAEAEVAENLAEENVSQGLNEQDLPGYDRMMGEVEGIIEKSKKRRVSEAKTADNVLSYVMGSKVYENATDVQREALVRDIRKRFGLKEKAAPSVARLFGKIKDVKKITMTEKVALKKQIRDLGKGAKQAVKAQKLASQQLSKDIKELSSKGVITVKQAANIITKFSKVNLLNEMSVSNFVDYMAKVFADAEYDNKIKVAKSKLSKARKNIATKIGIADGLMLPLKKLFAINPSLIPDSSLERYLELLDIFSASRKVLNLEQRDVVKADVDAILNEINNEQSRADALAEIFNNSDNRVFDNGELDYAASLKNMIKEGDITNEDAEVMRKYKQDILPQVEKSPLSEEEIAEKKEEYIKALKQMTVSGDGLPSQDERNLARNLAKLISDTSIENLMKLGVTDLKNLLKVADNINNDYLPHYAQIMVEKINAINNAEVIADSVKKAKPLSFTSLYSKFKAAIMRSQRGGIAEMVRRNPLFYIDQVFGDFKTKNIFDALFAKTAEAEASFKSELKKVQTILENAEAKVAKSFKLNPDETLMSKFKMMTYMIQLEYESNVGSQQVNPAAEYLKATIKHIDEGKSRFGERDANMLQEILNKYLQDGQIDNEKLFNSFNKAEKDAIKAIRGINESLKDKAQYTAAIIRGDAIDPLNNYVHLNVLHDTEALDVSAATDFLNQANDSRRPSTKAKSLISRTKGAKPLNFDIFASAQRGAKFVLLDYNLTEPIRTARRAMNQATKDLEADGRIPKQQREIKNAIDGAFEEAVTNLLTNSILQNSLADEAIDFISKQGYRAVLAGTGRFAAELTSNITFAVLADPKAFSAGIKYKDIIMSTDGPKIMENVNSKQTNRNYPSDTLSGKFIDTSILSQASGIQSASSKNPVFNKMQQIWNLTGKKYQNFVELTADTLISTPDKLVMRPMWFGSFANEFKKITGTDVDFEKIASNDQAYMDANKDAIEQSKNEADSKSVMTGATDNSFMGILKGTVKPNQSLSTRAFNNFNNYMTRFLIFEYVTARTAIYAMVGNGALSKRQGAAMLAAVATRMTVYTLLSHILANTIMGLFGIGDEEEEDEKSLMQKIGQSLTSTFVSLLLGRDFGNATKLVINYGVEEVNEKFLDFLREGDYDPYKDGIAYSIIPRDGKNDELGKLLMNMGGSFGPALNTASLIYKNRKGIPAVLSGGTTKKEMDAIIREERVVKERIPLEVLGHFGLIPLYKDVRKSVNTSIYASIKEAERAAAQRKREAEDLLGGYDNKTDLERYNPRLYEKNFGKGSEWYESTKEEREAKLKKAKEEREMKDRIYNYTEKDGFGSKKFTGKKSSKKKSSGFGSKKFGAD